MKHLIISIRMMFIMTILTGVVYPLFMTGVSQIFYPEKANGSFIKNAENKIVGSELIAQNFKSEKYFWPRPSAVDFNPMPSGGSNLGPTSQDLLTKAEERRKGGLTGDLLFASASGLDPHISPETATIQIERILKARNISISEKEKLERLVKDHTEGRQFGFLGENRVNVLKLNLALDQEF